MVNLIILGEGQTEEAFVRDVLAPELVVHNVFAEAYLLETSKTGRGGGVTLDRACKRLEKILKQRHDTYVTTMFDLYGLGPTFPGFTESRGMNPQTRAAQIEDLFINEVMARIGCRRDRFIPHIQPYEFEGLLFSDIRRFGELEAGWTAHETALKEVRNRFETPEHINDSPHTAPSKRLKSLLKPKYDKVLHGPALAGRIGLRTIRAACHTSIVGSRG